MKVISPFWDQVPDHLRCALCRFPYQRAVQLTCCGTVACRSCAARKLRTTHLFCWVRPCFARLDPDTPHHVVSAPVAQRELHRFLQAHPKMAHRLRARHHGHFQALDPDSDSAGPVALPDVSNVHPHRVGKRPVMRVDAAQPLGGAPWEPPSPGGPESLPRLSAAQWQAVIRSMVQFAAKKPSDSPAVPLAVPAPVIEPAPGPARSEPTASTPPLPLTPVVKSEPAIKRESSPVPEVVCPAPSTDPTPPSRVTRPPTPPSTTAPDRPKLVLQFPKPLQTAREKLTRFRNWQNRRQDQPDPPQSPPSSGPTTLLEQINERIWQRRRQPALAGEPEAENAAWNDGSDMSLSSSSDNEMPWTSCGSGSRPVITEDDHTPRVMNSRHSISTLSEANDTDECRAGPGWRSSSRETHHSDRSRPSPSSYGLASDDRRPSGHPSPSSSPVSQLEHLPPDQARARPSSGLSTNSEDEGDGPRSGRRHRRHRLDRSPPRRSREIRTRMNATRVRRSNRRSRSSECSRSRRGLVRDESGGYLSKRYRQLRARESRADHRSRRIRASSTRSRSPSPLRFPSRYRC